jgi:hypothetical protein
MPKVLSEANGRKLLGSQNLALVRHLDRRAVAIAGFHDDKPSDLGSGTCITVGGRFFISTAAHVVQEFTNEELFVIHTRAPSNVRVPILRRGARGGEADPEDVAFLELAAEEATKLGKDFVEVSRLLPGISELPKDNVLVYGYPTEMIDRVLLKEEKLRVQPIGYLSPTMPLASIRNARGPLRADYDLFFEYPERENILSTGEELLQLPAALGISGGGVWTTCLDEDGVWAPSKCRMIAIERSWPEYEWCRCTQIQHWLDLVRTEIPELQAEVDRILATSP